MQRDIHRFTRQEYDVLIIGGGIYGACLAHDAALRGLSVALLEKGDFSSGTSANSLKIIHGGLRYLKDLNFSLMRKMVRERQAWLRIAPELVQPLPIIMPTYVRQWPENKPVMRVANMLNELFSTDRNQGVRLSAQLPPGRILSREECLQRLPGLNPTGVSGGFLWYDAQIRSPERLLLALLHTASANSAHLANYCRVTGYLLEGNRVVGVMAKDEITGRKFKVKARMVANCVGPWTDGLLAKLDIPKTTPRFQPSSAMNLVTRKIPLDHACCLPGKYEKRDPNGRILYQGNMLFLIPWLDVTIIGTVHAPDSSLADEQWVNNGVTQALLDDVNAAYPPACLRKEDVYRVLQGYLPKNHSESTHKISLMREGKVHDHLAEDGIAGLISLIGVKFTTARYLAEKAVDIVFQKLAMPAKPCQTAEYPLRNAIFSPAITTDNGAEAIHAVRYEMAQHLSDVVMRRTTEGATGHFPEQKLWAMVSILAEELNWDYKRIKREIEDVYAVMPGISTEKYNGHHQFENG